MSVIIYIVILICGILSLSCHDSESGKVDSKPNFIVIFIDDMGYGDIGPFGSSINDTPHLDRMAEEGLKLSSFYVASAVCSPSRAGLLTGSYPKRVGLAKGPDHVVLFPGDSVGLNPSEITIADLLKKAGYATGMFGKWHLGDQPQFLPTEHGFDEYFGIPYSNDMWPKQNNWQFPYLPILNNKEVVDTVRTMEDQAQLASLFTEHAIDFIRQNKDQPFFVYLPHAFIHEPRAARSEFMGDAETVIEAQIEEIDWSVGQIMQTLRKEGLEDNTLVLFTSDNGGADGSSMGPLRGGKGTVWEGGFRVPTLAWWPGTIPSASATEEVATAMDLLPTFANLAGIEVPDDRIIDGENISDLLKRPSEASSPHEHFYYYIKDELSAVRSGSWKFIQPDKLFNLENDISESLNVAEEYPEIVERLKKTMNQFELDMQQQARTPGMVENSRTILPRPGVEGEKAYKPTLSIDR